MRRGPFKRRNGVELDLDDIQATVLRRRPEPYYGTHALVEILDQQQGRQALGLLREQVAAVDTPFESSPAWTAVAITYQGLVALGVPESSLATFPHNFCEGMAARAKQLRDEGPNDPRGWQPPFGSGRVHLAISVYAASEAGWQARVADYQSRLASFPGLRVVYQQDFGAQPGDRNAFGYKDGFTQPVVQGSGEPAHPGDGEPIKAGEFVLGYPSETGVPLPQPQPDALGRNGTYVVFRKYQSHVAAFNEYLHRNASTAAARELLAAKLVGRWRSGAPLALAPAHDDPDLGADDNRNNDFRYGNDQQCLVTPRGAHIRRMNPRDTQMSILANVNIRRIIRRSTTYGTPLPADAVRDDGQERGLDFIALGVRAIDNVEFLQSEWVSSGNFMGLGKERDPMLGIQERNPYFTVPGTPPRRVKGIQSFNTLRGGEYLFMPSLTALDWLANLPDTV
ncbi:peroxidase [Nakamurella sp. DB0629]|uniref:Peroxidase n=1 Tax=Nakamurella aerolata TaxID=1656892 RepID=A0A849A9X9_9ACTN|nr:peroxidase [Nakamurella aerolata]